MSISEDSVRAFFLTLGTSNMNRWKKLTADFPMTRQRFMKRLDEVGVKYEYKFYGDETNKLGHVFHLDMRNETGRICNDEECAFFRSFL